jgi:hypothetical protein
LISAATATNSTISAGLTDTADSKSKSFDQPLQLQGSSGLFFSDTKPATTVTKDTKSPLFNFSSSSGKNQSVNNQKESTPAIQLYVSFQPTAISSGGFFDFDKNLSRRRILPLVIRKN